jgi:Glycosyl transferase family 8
MLQFNKLFVVSQHLLSSCAGLFVFTPSAIELQHFEHLLESGTVEIGGFAEQDFLNHVYRSSWQPLPASYNLQKGIKHHHAHIWCLEEAFIIHYTDDKPWSHRYSPGNSAYQEICDLWWAIYRSGCLGYGMAKSLSGAVSLVQYAALVPDLTDVTDL